MAKTLFILNDGPYGSERSYNGIRLASSLSKRADQEVKIFLIGDAASCAKAHQKVPQGQYNIELMLKGALMHQAQVGVCGTCMDARGMTEVDLVEGTARSTLEILTNWTEWADKTLVF